MSQRKLQQDIDKLLKKVKEGLIEFEEVYDKFQSTDPENSSHREKLESDLKREIKKLQKHRDQIKTWLSKEDVKDKQDALKENRRAIENGMERFKSVEKLMKTKQFSTEALTNPDIIKDPRELKKRDQFVFIQDCLDELQRQLESYEAQDQHEQVERHEFHIHNLENVLKLLQNNEMEPETVEEYQDDIKYYIENNDEPDFIEYDTLYEDMGCESKPNQEDNKEVSSSIAISSSATAAGTVATTISTIPTTGNNNASLKQVKKTERSPKKKAQHQGVTSTASTPTRGTPVPVSPQSPSPESAGLSHPNNGTSNSTKKSETDCAQSREELPFPPDKSEQISQQIERDIKDNDAFKNPLFGEGLKYWLNSKRPLMQPYNDMPERMVSQLESSLLNCPDSLDADSPHFYRKPLSLPHPTSIFFPNEPIRFVYPNDNGPFHAQNQSEEQLQNSKNGESDQSGQSHSWKTEQNSGEDIYSRTSLAKIFTKFDLDTLFFIFYHYQGTYDQFLAARELSKNRKWRFSKKDRCWYYKEVEKLPPGLPQSEEESWRYFDYQGSWLARRCNNDMVPKEEDFEKIF
ncbi:hypothetical protein HG536_0B02080 [Torulaspora globosa]|uniref:General negative regulator of transcription subunit n=1 Tax=Torulaspora globosa TaxID=48254 RepID=A0A7G3ZCV9_9SACH|nr:uncharacterized protein HG536_0B02080 [Torulaspora globosa]QLL31345.1 hypothetical protein HG536_0B02080 [Torulaspora globosa]